LKQKLFTYSSGKEHTDTVGIKNKFQKIIHVATRALKVSTQPRHCRVCRNWSKSEILPQHFAWLRFYPHAQDAFSQHIKSSESNIQKKAMHNIRLRGSFNFVWN